MTQLQLAEKLGVSDKTVSKWETAKGYPDITLLESIADAFSISVTELISGNTVQNSNVSANMTKSKFYVCPICGNVIHSMGEAVINCHGVLMTAAEPEETDENHKISIERIEDDYGIVMNVETERKVNSMCNLSEVVLEHGIAQGMERGMERGMAQGIELVAENMLKANKPIEEIEQMTGITQDKLVEMKKKLEG